MRHTIYYKNSMHHPIGYIEIQKTDYTLTLRLLRSNNKYRKKVDKLYFDIVKRLEEDYHLIISDHNHKVINMLNPSRDKNHKRYFKNLAPNGEKA